MANNDITLTIDGQRVQTSADKSVLQAARDAGIYIPTLCDHPWLKPYGGCRLCIVQVEGMRGLPAACVTKVSDGMVVRNDVDEVNQVRKVVCELLISDHPAECLQCWSDGDCRLQEVAAWLGVRQKRMKFLNRKKICDESNPFYIRDLGKCILCGICTRVCDEVRSVNAIEIAGRGFEARVASFMDGPVRESTCVSCGSCVDACPVGALAPKKGLRVPSRTVTTTCPYCGCGCGLEIGVRAGKIVSVKGDSANTSNSGLLCVKGRFGLDFVNSDERLTTPLIKKDGEFQKATWDEALSLVASRLKEIKEKHGADAIAGLSSAKVTNEENYLFQKFIRAVIGTNNVDHCARLCHASTVAGLARAFGSGAMTNSMDEIEHADCILITGSNTTEAHPIIGLRVKNAVKKHGARLVVADPRRIEIVQFAELHLRQRSGTDVALFNAMMKVILSEGLADEAFIKERCENFDAFKETLDQLSLEQAASVTGVAAEDIQSAARIYATAKRASIIYSMGITQHTTGTDNVLALANLAMLTGNVGKESTGVNPLRGQNNVQGACDLGALPNVYPGYQKVDDPDAHSKFTKVWDAKLSDKVGLTIVEIMNAICEDKVKALYIMGENPMLSDPNVNHVSEALDKVDLLVVQDIFLTETAAKADIVLPAASFAEKDGTFTSTERRVQRVCKVFDAPGEAREDLQIIADLATRLGTDMGEVTASGVMDEIASVSPIYGGISFSRLENEVLCWPCGDENHPGTRFLHEGEFKRGRGKFHATPFREAAELPDEEYPMLLTTGRMLYHFHTGTMTRKTAGLDEICPPAPIEINPEDAAEAGIAPDSAVEVSSRRGTVMTRAVVTERSPRGTVFMPFHFKEGAANVLTNDALDPIAKIPEFKVCAVRLKSVKAAAVTT